MGSLFEMLVRKQDLEKLPRDTQIDAMRHWFFENYEDPAERTPYESREGGYIWIFGGPYDAAEVLHEKFDEVVPDDAIDELVRELNHTCSQWAPREKSGDYEDAFLDSLQIQENHHASFFEGISQIETLLTAKYDKSSEGMYLRMLFAGVVSLLETYLGATFMHALKSDSGALRRFVETTPEFKKQQVPIAQVFEVMDSLEQSAMRHLADLVWHNLAKVSRMYGATFDIKFPESPEVFAAILKRHDIVHRNGKDKDGSLIEVTANDVENLILHVTTLVNAIEAGFEDDEPF